MSGRHEVLMTRYRRERTGTTEIPLVIDQFVPCHCQDEGEPVHRHSRMHTRLHERPLRCPESQEAAISRDPRLLSSFPLRGYTMQQQHTISPVLRISRMCLDCSSSVERPSCLIDISCSNSLNSSVASVFASLPNYNQLSPHRALSGTFSPVHYKSASCV
jgi:hypothetical protein